ncbi:MAG: hypothetical protein ABI831_21105 [Betaproteobacteria bacterium]
MKFHLAHIVPGKMFHGLNGYKEVIDTVQWGLQQLGHSAEYGLNTFSTTATNIVFGWQMLEMDTLNDLPPETIAYNLEQGRGWTAEGVKPQFRIVAQRLKVWDYSAGNALLWTSLGAREVCVVPVGYAPILKRIPKPPVQEIDVLFYGSTGQDRLNAFHGLYQTGLTTVFVAGLYGVARDELIARSKLIVNINLYALSKMFELVRVSYLLANRKAVVAVVDADTLIDQDLRSAVRISPPAQLAEDCVRLASDDAARASLEEAGFVVIEKRDIRQILQRAFDGGAYAN